INGGQLFVPSSRVAMGERRRLRIAAGDVSLAHAAPQASTILNALPTRIVSKTPIGEHEIIIVLSFWSDVSGARILTRITRRSWDQLRLTEGMSVFAQVKGVSLALK